MAFTKTQATERTEILSPKEHRVISSELKRTGKVSVNDLSSKEKQELTTKVANS